ncbi:hypothetical protein [Neobacillus dielmonensis]|uniref:hypothetical protein n=1 Tax=Neobacillus dielmonensis TaxID=1347369 RepID=UPI0005A5E5EA|nr:hypothetical protein [Neobacillus dielmonensis]
MGFWGDLKKEVLTEDNKKKLGAFSRTAKTELSKLPIISIIGDATQGVSGLGKVQKLLKEEPNNPIYWLFYYEAFLTHRHLKGGVSVARGVINPIGFIVGKGLSTGLNTIDDEYEKFDPKKCLLMIFSLVSKKIKEKTASVSELAIYAKAQYYLAVLKTGDERETFLKHAIKNMSLAIEKEREEADRAEYFFYLAQMYKTADRNQLSIRALNISRKLGFLPAHEELASILKSDAKQEETERENLQRINENMDQLSWKCPYKEFKYSYKLDLGVRVDHTIEHVLEEQSKKISQTVNRIGNFFK